MTIPVTITCGICKKSEKLDEIKAREFVVLGFHICDGCFYETLCELGLQDTLPPRRKKYANVALPVVRH